jgi:putative Holliday junction resolvase
MNDKPVRILGIDPGKKRIGLAIGDTLLKVATGYITIEYKNMEEFIAILESIVDEEDIGLIVMGLPVNMDGSEGESANFSRLLAELIKRKLNLEVEFIDERLTTEEAIRQIHQADKKVGKSKKTIDMLSAAIILQAYLDKS